MMNNLASRSHHRCQRQIMGPAEITRYQFIAGLRSSKRLDDQQLVRRWDRLHALASAEGCLNDQAAEELAQLREAIIPELHRLKCNRRWLQLSAIARAQAGKAS
jgi:hypothetical protein